MRKAIKISSAVILAFYVVFFMMKDYIKINITRSLPFLGTYELNGVGALLYLFPFLSMLILYLSSKEDSNLLNYALMIGLIEALPFLTLLSTRNYHLVYYLFLLLPILNLFFFAVCTFIFQKSVLVKDKAKKDKINILLFLLPVLLAFFINIIPTYGTNYLIGADIYFHAALNAKDSFQQNPYFLEEVNRWYPPLGYAMVNFVSQMTSIDTLTIWKYLTAVSASLVFFLLIISLRKARLGNKEAAIAVIFIIPLIQFLLVDPSIRIVAYLLLMVQLLLLVMNKRVLASIMAPIIGMVHLEIGLHSVLILLFYFSIPYILRQKEKILKEYQHTRVRYSFDYRVLLTLFIITVIIFLYMWNEYPHEIYKNDIVLSLFFPVGIISVVPCCLFLGYLARGRFMQSHLPFLALSLISTSAFFFFTKIWIFYHRYFFETAYVGIAVIGSYELLKYINMNKQASFRYWMVGIITVLFLFSIIPRMGDAIDYKTTLDSVIRRDYQQAFTLINRNEISESVILIQPNSYLNRFIPAYTGNYILAGSTEASNFETPNTISFCVGSPFKKNCLERLNLSKAFFKNPTQNNLNKIKAKYKVNYLLLDREDLTKIDVRRLDVTFVDENRHYYLVKIT